MGRGLGGAVPAPAAADPIGNELKPRQGDQLDAIEDLDELAEQDLAAVVAEELEPVDGLELTPQEQALRDNLDRRLADAAVVRALAAEGFAGKNYARFEMQLAEYGMAVLPGFIKHGKIWAHCARGGVRLTPTEADLRALEADGGQGAHDLAATTVAVTVKKFRKLALVQGRWSPEGGASLTTYFMGLVRWVFPNELRRWRRERLSDLITFAPEELPDDEYDHEFADPAHGVAYRDVMRGCLARFSDKQRDVVGLSCLDLEQGEIAAVLGLSSARAVEGRLHRLRQDPATRGKVVGHA